MPAAAASDSNDPKTVLLSEVAAARAGDREKISALRVDDGVTQNSKLMLVADIAIAQGKFDQALGDHFGIEAAGREMKRWPQRDVALIRSSKVTIRGETADVVFDDSGHTKIVLTLQDGHWRLPVSAITRVVENAAPHEVGGRYVNVAHAWTEVADQIKLGQYPTAEAAAQAAEDRVNDAVEGKDAQ